MWTGVGQCERWLDRVYPAEDVCAVGEVPVDEVSCLHVMCRREWFEQTKVCS